MNERIRELIDECTEWITGTIDGDVECFDKEKFALLIVRKCAEVADTADATREKWEGIGKYVREYFGVEE